MTDAQQCAFIRSDGTRCGTRFGIREDGMCFAHSTDPAVRERRAKARAKGSMATSRKYRTKSASFAKEDEVPPCPETAADAARWASWLTRAVSIGTVAPAVAREISGALRIYLAALKDSTTEDDIAELQETFAELRAQLTGPGPKAAP